VVTNDATPLIPQLPRTPYYRTIRETWKTSGTPDFALMELGKLSWKMVTHDPVNDQHSGFQWSHLKARTGEVLTCVALWVLSLVIFGLFVWGSIASAGIITDSVALSASPDCGWWISDPSAPLTNGTYGLYYLQEVESGDYASRCYGAAPGTDGCNFYFTQDIPYSETDDILDDKCPFSDELCLNGGSSAFTMRSKFISSKDLGINVPLGYLFSRSTTCSPIRTDPYTIDKGTSYEYHYGINQAIGNATFSTSKIQTKIFSGYDVA
jgi:hypothetical protein